MALFLLLGCLDTAGLWSGDVACSHDFGGGDVDGAFVATWALGPRSRWSTGGTGSFRGEWDGQGSERIGWYHELELDGQREDAGCNQDDEEIAGFRWVGEDQISVQTDECTGDLFR